MQIRQETPQDFIEVYHLIKTAFDNAEHRDGTEQDLVVLLRKSPAFRPELSLVAEENGVLYGYLLFTEVQIGSRTALVLAKHSWSTDTVLPNLSAIRCALSWAVKPIIPKPAMFPLPASGSAVRLTMYQMQILWRFRSHQHKQIGTALLYMTTHLQRYPCCSRIHKPMLLPTFCIRISH